MDTEERIKRLEEDVAHYKEMYRVTDALLSLQIKITKEYMKKGKWF